MKKRLYSILLVMAMMLSLLVSPGVNVAAATSTASATAGLNVSKKVVVMGTTYQFTLKNVDSSKVKSTSWKANRTSIAKVDQSGLVTPVKAGTTTIKCTVNYTNGNTATYSAKVTVKNHVKATSVKITGATVNSEGYIVMHPGEKITLKASVTPQSANDTAFFYSVDGTVATAGSTTGVIRAKKNGITMVTVKMALTSAKAKSSTVTANVFIKVEDKPAPTATPVPTEVPASENPYVTSAKITGANELTINFSESVMRSTIISDGSINPKSVVIGAANDAHDIGVIKASLANSRKSLVITTSGVFNGTYSVTVSSNVKNDSGKTVNNYGEILTANYAIQEISLPSPVSANQNSENKSQIDVVFENKLDKLTAEDPANYIISNLGAVPEKAEIVKESVNSTTVALTFREGTFTATSADYELVIQQVKGYDGSYAAIKNGKITFTATENELPKLTTENLVIGDGFITATFNESVTGTCMVTVTDVYNSNQVYSATGSAAGNVLTIGCGNLGSSRCAIVKFTDISITDMNGNKADLSLENSYAATR